MRSILKNKKGDFTGLIFFIVSIAAFAIFIILVSYSGRTIATALKGNMTVASTEHQAQIDKAFTNTLNVTATSLSAIWYIIFAVLLIGLFITAWFIPTHPIFIAPFIILLIIAVIIGSAMSNAYIEISKVATFASESSTQAGVAFFMTKLPYIALIVGLMTLLITFAKPQGIGGGEAPIG